MSDPTASGNDSVDARNRAIYDAQSSRIQVEIDEFWRRIPGPKRFDGARVLDFGCGTGQMAVELARRGAAEVVGLEISAERAAYATDQVAEAYPEYSDRIRFSVEPLESIPDRSFDFVVSKDTFEHIVGIERIAPMVADKVASGGHMLVGFSLLWYSMFGDHRLSKYVLGKRLPVPWFHVLIGDDILLKFVNRGMAKAGEPQRASFQEFGFNQLTFHEFRDVIVNLGLDVVQFDTNSSSNQWVHRLGQLKVPKVLENYWIRSIYAHLRRP